MVVCCVRFGTVVKMCTEDWVHIAWAPAWALAERGHARLGTYACRAGGREVAHARRREYNQVACNNILLSMHSEST